MLLLKLATKTMDYRSIGSERQFKDATGYSKESFDLLLSDFEDAYHQIKGQSYETYLAENVVEDAKIKTLGDGLFLVLFQLKNDLIWGSLGVVFGMAASTAQSNFKLFFSVLEVALEKKSDAQAKLQFGRGIRGTRKRGGGIDI